MTDLAARWDALRERIAAHEERRACYRRLGDAITDEGSRILDALRELEELDAARASAKQRKPLAPAAPEPLAAVVAAWGRGAVARALEAGRLDLVEDLGAWERALGRSEAADWLGEIVKRLGIPAPELLDILHRFRCDVRLADPTRPFLERRAARRFAGLSRLIERAAQEVDAWRGLWPILFADHLRAVAELVAAGKAPDAGVPDAVDRWTVQMRAAGTLVAHVDSATGTTSIVAAVPVEVERVRVVLGALAALASRFEPRRVRLEATGEPLLAKKGRGPESAHLLARIRRLEAELGARTAGTLTFGNLAVCVALALPERYESQLGPDADPSEWLRRLRRRGRRRGGRSKVD